MEFRYEIDETNTLRVWNDEQAAPFLLQPTYPNGDEWTVEQATAWAEVLITSLSDTTAPLPGGSAAEPTIPRPEIVPVPESTPPAAE